MEDFTESYSFAYNDGTRQITFDFTAETLDEVAQQFADFVRGVGFSYVDGITIHTNDGYTVEVA